MQLTMTIAAAAQPDRVNAGSLWCRLDFCAMTRWWICLEQEIIANAEMVRDLDMAGWGLARR